MGNKVSEADYSWSFLKASLSGALTDQGTCCCLVSYWVLRVRDINAVVEGGLSPLNWFIMEAAANSKVDCERFKQILQLFLICGARVGVAPHWYRNEFLNSVARFWESHYLTTQAAIS